MLGVQTKGAQNSNQHFVNVRSTGRQRDRALIEVKRQKAIAIIWRQASKHPRITLRETAAD